MSFLLRFIHEMSSEREGRERVVETIHGGRGGPDVDTDFIEGLGQSLA